MQIDNQGITLDTMQDIISADEVQLQGTYGADFYIKPEGVIDNIFASAAFMEMDLQGQIAFLTKQFDPETAEGIWQDALYERIGVQRIEAQPTTFKQRVNGTAGFTGVAGDITIRSDLTGEEFTNTEGYTLTADGVILTFECVVAGATEVQAAETFKIVTAPDAVSGLATSAITDIDIGRNRETDSEYRARYRNSKAIDAKATRNANIANLSKYVDNENYLAILDKKNDQSMDAGEIEIIAKHNTTDAIFADAIFNTVADGIDFIGNTSVTLQDASGEDVTIKFYKADEIAIDFNITATIKSGYVQDTVFNNAKNAIINYVQNIHIFGLNSILFATEFIVPLLQTDGMAAVTEIQIKKHSDVNYSDSIQLTQFEIPTFDTANMTITTGV